MNHHATLSSADLTHQSLWWLSQCWQQGPHRSNTVSAQRGTMTHNATNNPTVTDEKEKKTQRVMLLTRQWHYNAVMVFPEVTISSSWPKSNQFGSKSRNAQTHDSQNILGEQLIWSWLNLPVGQGTVLFGFCCWQGKSDQQSCCSYSKPILQHMPSPENNTLLDIQERKEQQNSVIYPNRGNVSQANSQGGKGGMSGGKQSSCLVEF